MSSVTGLISNITGFMIYFAPGYIFLFFFQYSACLQRENDERHLVIKSIVISYVLYNVLDCIFLVVAVSDQEFYALDFIIAVVVGIICGKIHRSKWWNGISYKLFKREFERNTFLEIWEEVNNKNKKSILYARIVMKADGSVYDGQVTRIFSCYSNPVIQMEYYCLYNKDGTLLDDNLEDDDIVVLLNYSDILHFEYQISDFAE